MKKYIITSLLLFIPFVSMAADHCTNPKEYTVDKRCYVTDEQKKKKPYNAVVGLISSKSIVYCTGTIVEEKNGKPYLYTAKHCVFDEKYSVRPTIHIKLQDGRALYVNKNNVGNYIKDATEGHKYAGDWAIYSITESDVPMVKKTNKKSIGIGPFTYDYNARVVGYGSLKIMSDKEINNFKQKYEKYLKDNRVNPDKFNKVYGLEDGGVNTDNARVRNFLEKNPLEENYELKVSKCEYSSNGKKKDCQTWHGNSGGPIFDDDDTIMGIHTRGQAMIGGEHHARPKNGLFEPAALSVPLLKD